MSRYDELRAAEDLSDINHYCSINVRLCEVEVGAAKNCRDVAPFEIL